MDTAAHELPSVAPEVLEELGSFNSPTIANAIETFDIRPRSAGCSTQQVKCIFPEFGVLVGFACTATIVSGHPAEKPRRVNRRHYWDYLAAGPGPKIIVMQDLTEPPAGAYWGEVNTNIHRALGCTGLVTNGSVRDLDEVRPQRFPMWAGAVTVSHAYAHLEDFGKAVRIGDLLIEPGDLVHADLHGFVVIPNRIAARIAEAAREIERKERIIIDLCKSPKFEIDQLDKLVHPDY